MMVSLIYLLLLSFYWIAIIATAVIIGAVIFALRSLKKDFLFGDAPFPPEISPEGALGESYAFYSSGDPDLPFSVYLNRTFYRWQQNTYLRTGKRFYTMFEDGPWKWEAQGRFAGKGINCGHYFGLSVDAASEEAGHYGIDRQNATLLELRIKSRRVLDLTHPEVIAKMFRAHVNNHQSVSHSYYTLVQELVERGSGGNAITDYFGYTACKQRYDGLLFFSARAMDVLNLQLKDRVLEAFEYASCFKELRRDVRLQNAVFFSGATLVARTRTFGLQGAAALENPYFEKDVETVSNLFTYNEDYQQKRKDFVLFPPSYVSGP